MWLTGGGGKNAVLKAAMKALAQQPEHNGARFGRLTERTAVLEQCAGKLLATATKDNASIYCVPVPEGASHARKRLV